jgi:hypothetical protein
LKKLALAVAVLALAVGATSALAKVPPHHGPTGPGGGKGHCHKGQINKHGHCVGVEARPIQGGTYGQSTELFEVDTAKKTVAFFFGPLDCGAGNSYSGEPGSRATGKLPSTKVGTTIKLSGSDTTEENGFSRHVTWNVQARFATFNVLKVKLHLSTVLTGLSPGSTGSSCEKTYNTTLFVTAA